MDNSVVVWGWEASVKGLNGNGKNTIQFFKSIIYLNILAIVNNASLQ